jgi:hypothetical protein
MPPADQLADYAQHLARSNPMLDFLLLALGLGFFALSIAYAFGCDHL